MNKIKELYKALSGIIILSLLIALPALAQEPSDSVQQALTAGRKPVKNTFDGNFIIDNQTVMVNPKGTFEFDFQHRFGLVTHGIQDMFGLYEGATIRLGVSYVPIKNLQVGIGSYSDPMQVDGNVKYSIWQQTRDNKMPVSVTAFGNMIVDTRSADNFVNNTDRLSYFGQLIIARKFTDKFSAQVAPSVSHFNNIQGYLDEQGNVQPSMHNTHIAVAFSGRYKITEGTTILVNYDQPITQHQTNNPHPNVSFGCEWVTSGHQFQVFFSNYSYIAQQRNNFFNTNDYTKGQYLIGFNISRLWNF
ncbi:MAG: hypothetical protein JST46_09445 [Bacteroidetes bacterium]|nr:hypothetical protein [Bacteroidota bacterium]